MKAQLQRLLHSSLLAEISLMASLMACFVAGIRLVAESCGLEARRSMITVCRRRYIGGRRSRGLCLEFSPNDRRRTNETD